jgi:hypothetical protein
MNVFRWCADSEHEGLTTLLVAQGTSQVQDWTPEEFETKMDDLDFWDEEDSYDANTQLVARVFGGFREGQVMLQFTEADEPELTAKSIWVNYDEPARALSRNLYSRLLKE